MATPALVQQASSIDTASPFNPALTLTPAAADILVANVIYVSSGVVVGASVSDDAGNVWVRACSSEDLGGSGTKHSVFYTLNPKAQSTTITATDADPTVGAGAVLRVAEFSGVLKIPALVATAREDFGGGPLFNTAVVNVATQALIVAGIWDGLVAPAQIAETAMGFTTIGGNPFPATVGTHSFAYKIVNAPGQQQYTTYDAGNASAHISGIIVFQSETPAPGQLLEVGSLLGRGGAR